MKPVRIRDIWLYLAAAILLASCSGTAVKAPVEARGPGGARFAPIFHTVRKGETLYSITWRYGLDYKAVAGWNSISPPYLIYPGERLRLRAGSMSRTPAIRSRGTRKSAKAVPSARQAVNTSETARERAGLSKAGGGKSVSGIKKSGAAAAKNRSWTWPAEGRIIERYRASGNKGLDIAGKLGQPVFAAKGGRVVYSGSGLIGYGKLIIVKHNKKYLSAYAHNDRLLVKEGDEVAGGQRIARMGRTGADRVKLHFEIRRDGKPVDPLRYLPRT